MAKRTHVAEMPRVSPKDALRRRSLYFFLLFTGPGCKLMSMQPWRAHLLPPLRSVQTDNVDDTCSEDEFDFVARLVRRGCFALANSLEVDVHSTEGEPRGERAEKAVHDPKGAELDRAPMIVGGSAKLRVILCRCQSPRRYEVPARHRRP